jgi:hypothetical protein
MSEVSSEDGNNQQNNEGEEQQQQDINETLDPEEPVVVEGEEGAGAEPEQEPEPEQPQPTPAPAETPSTSNNALIMQIKILSEYAKDIKRSMNAVANAAGVHHEYVRRPITT